MMVMEFVKGKPKTCILIIDDCMRRGLISSMSYEMSNDVYPKVDISLMVTESVDVTDDKIRINLARNYLGILFRDALDNNDQDTVDVLAPILTLMDL